MAYLDPKNDLTFKKVFGQHPNLLKSFLNAVLPLANDEVIETMEYLPAELVPEIPILKHTIVDVRCKDNKGRQFIVEMQMFWTESFKHRIVFNASKAYVKQLDRAKNYSSLQPVYALSLVDDIFDTVTDQYFHHYKIVNIENTEHQLKGLEFVFIELPKFKPQNRDELKMQVLWLRFLTEIKDGLEVAPHDLMMIPEIREALDNVRVSAFTKDELDKYDRYWDSIRSEITLYEDAEQRGKIEGHEMGIRKGMEMGIKEGVEMGKKEGLEMGIKEGMEMGIKEGVEMGIKEGVEMGKKEGLEMGKKEGELINTYKVALKLKTKDMPINEIAEITGLTNDIINQVEQLLEENKKDSDEF